MNTQKRKIFFVMISMAFVFVFLFIFTKLINNRHAYKGSFLFQKDWNVITADQVITSADLQTLNFAPAQRGDTLILSNKIPDDLNFRNPMLRIWLCHSAFDIYLDDKLLCSYAKDNLQEHTIIGSGYHWIPLPADFAGQEIKFLIYINEPNALATIEVPVIGEADKAIPDLISENFSIVFASIFLIVLGLALTLPSLIMSLISPGFSQLVYTGIFSGIIGTWTLCNRSIIQIVSDNRVLNMYLEYFSVYLGPLPILLFLQSIRKQKSRSGFKMAHLFIFINLLLIVCTLACHFLHIVNFPQWIPIYHVLDIAIIIYFITSIVIQILHGRREEQYLLLGIILMTFCFAYDLLIFNVSKYFAGNISNMIGLSAWGGLAFIGCMLFSYGCFIKKGITNQIEKETLLKMAYSDQLTKLYNRNYYMQHLTRLEAEHLPYTVISFDLNFLKHSNDSLGHNSGDLLLCCFASVLKDSFEEYGHICRVGGDEFSVLIDGCDPDLIQNLLLSYRKRLLAENQKGHPFPISAAWGVAFSLENKNANYSQIINLADKRMYKKKATMKERSSKKVRSKKETKA